MEQICFCEVERKSNVQNKFELNGCDIKGIFAVSKSK